MSFLARLFRSSPDPREELRPLWHRVVALSRETHWYAREGVADSVPGRFDMIVAILVVVLLRMENDEELAPKTALLTELFVEDMDGQLREGGVGDLMVGKHIGKLVSVLGGRLGAFRSGLASADEAALADALARNVTMLEGRDATALAAELRRFAQQLAEQDAGTILAAEIAG